MKKASIFLCLVCFSLFAFSQTATKSKIITGADRMEVYLPLLKGKNVAVFANQTSIVGYTHLVDTLLKSGIKIVKIFGPEHGFRGTADAGEHVTNAVDKKTGIPVISLYGDHKKPTADDVKDVDVLLFDIQDVGVRFYTFISSLQYYLEAALEFHKPLLILDRPNPNGFYVDGPVLNMKFKSFVGMQPVPIVYGMTIGEYAMMLAGEKWLSPQANAINSYNTTIQPTNDTPFHFLVIKCKGYDHASKYVLQLLYKLSILNVFEFFNELILLSLLINRSNNKNKNNSKTNNINKNLSINIYFKKIKIRIILIFIHISAIRLFQIFDDISLSYIFLFDIFVYLIFFLKLFLV